MVLITEKPGHFLQDLISIGIEKKDPEKLIINNKVVMKATPLFKVFKVL